MVSVVNANVTATESFRMCRVSSRYVTHLVPLHVYMYVLFRYNFCRRGHNNLHPSYIFQCDVALRRKALSGDESVQMYIWHILGLSARICTCII